MFWYQRTVSQAAGRRQRFLCCKVLSAALKTSLVSFTQLLLWGQRWFTKDWPNTANKAWEGTTSFLDFFCFPYYPLYIKFFPCSKKPSLEPLLATWTTFASLWRSNAQQCIRLGQVSPSQQRLAPNPRDLDTPPRVPAGAGHFILTSAVSHISWLSMEFSIVSAFK